MSEAHVSPLRLRTLYVMRILLEYSDENHLLSSSDIVRRLKEYGVNAERKSIYTDIAILKQFGMEITTEPNVGYFVNHRTFELAELKLLVDAVQSSKFITEKSSRKLIKKLESLTSKMNGAQLQRQVFIRNRLKSGNTAIFYNVDKIHAAILKNEKVTFRYCEWTVKKQLRVKKDGALYNVSPWALTWDDENYYLVGCIETGDKIEIRHFRVDKMKDLELLDGVERVGKDVFEGFDLATFAKKTFGMYGGKDYIVTLNCTNRLVGVVIDRFGKDVPIIPLDDEHFETKVLVSVSPQFFGWVTGVGNGMRITGPREVVEEYCEYMQRLMEQYKKEEP